MKNKSKITTFYINSQKGLDKWIKQNSADYTGDFIEGCLLDNFCLFCKNGYAAVYENYLNTWSSNYRIEFSRDCTVLEKFYDFAAAAEAENEL